MNKEELIKKHDGVEQEYLQRIAMASNPEYFLPEMFCALGKDLVDYLIPPVATADPKAASLETGAPPLQQISPKTGGAAFPRKEYNGIVRMLSSITAFQNKGGMFTFNPENISGYKMGAVLYDYSTNRLVKSLKDNNTVNFVTDPTKINDIDWSFISVTPDMIKNLSRLNDDNIWTGINRFENKTELVGYSTYQGKEIATIQNQSGKIWYEGENPLLTSTSTIVYLTYNNIAYFKGLWILATGYNSFSTNDYNFIYSTNGQVWKTCNTLAFGSIYGMCTGIAVSESMIVASLVDTTGNLAYIVYSYNGVDWYFTNAEELRGYYNVHYNKGVWVASYISSTTNSSGLVYSLDGLNWQKSNINNLTSSQTTTVNNLNDVWFALVSFQPSGVTTSIQFYKSLDGIKWDKCIMSLPNKNLLTGDYYITNIIYAKGNYFVGTSAISKATPKLHYMLYSPDGLNWDYKANVTIPILAEANLLSFTNNIFVGAGMQNFMYSEDGFNWLDCTGEGVESIKVNNTVPKICFGNGIFVMSNANAGAATTSEHNVIYSVDGKEWLNSNITNVGDSYGYSNILYRLGTWVLTRRAISTDEISMFYSMSGILSEDNVWTGKNTFKGETVLDGYSTYKGEEIATIKNTLGKIWLPTNIKVLTSTNSIIYGGSNFLAATDKGTFKWLNGDNWVQSLADKPISAVCFGNGLWTAFDSVNFKVWYSNDALTWTNSESLKNAVTDCKFKNGLWVATTLDGIYYSTNGMGFTLSNTTTGRFSGVNFNNSEWLATCETDGISGIYRSTDGKNWTRTLTKGNLNICTVPIYANNVWVVSCYANTTASNLGFYYSTNGSSWTKSSISVSEDKVSMSITYQNGIFLASYSGSETFYFYTSTDGKNWNVKKSNINFYSPILQAFNGLFFCKKHYGTGTDIVCYSIDGLTWSESNLYGDLDQNFHMASNNANILSVGGYLARSGQTPPVFYSINTVGQVYSEMFEEMKTEHTFLNRHLDETILNMIQSDDLELGDLNSDQPKWLKDSLMKFNAYKRVKLNFDNSVKLESGAYQRKMTEEQREQFRDWQDSLLAFLYAEIESEPLTPDFIQGIL